MSRVFFDKRKYHIGMIIRQGFSFKLKPDGAQDRKMSRFTGCSRWVYNQGLAWNEERRTAGIRGSVSIFVSRVVFKGATNHGCPSCIGG